MNLERELPQLEQLEHVRFSRCSCIMIDTSILKVCGASLKKIKSLSLEDCHNLDSGFFSLIYRLDNLETLNLKQCDDLEGDDLFSIARRCPKLKQFSLRDCKQITSVLLPYLIESLLHLTSLYLSGTYVNHLSLKAIAKNWPNLTFLDLTDGTITSDQLRARGLLAMAPHTKFNHSILPVVS